MSVYNYIKITVVNHDFIVKQLKNMPLFSGKTRPFRRKVR